jgi:cytoskeletal protein CcmA (bactofilin family)
MARRIFNAQTTNLTVESFGMEGGPQSARSIHVSGTIGTGTIAVDGRPTGSGAAYTPIRVRSAGVTAETFVTTIVALGNYII